MSDTDEILTKFKNFRQTKKKATKKAAKKKAAKGATKKEDGEKAASTNVALRQPPGKGNETDQIICSYEYRMSPDQLAFIEDNYAKYDDVLELARRCHQIPALAETSQEFENVRKYIAKLVRNVDVINFRPAEVEYIKRNAQYSKPSEIARTLFPEANITTTSKEVNTIYSFIVALQLPTNATGSEFLDDKYIPPKAESRVVSKINQEDLSANLSVDSLSSDEKRCVSRLISYLASKRFLATINAIQKQSHREILESTFIQTTWNKPDLNSEELNMCISMCRDYVAAQQVLEQMEDINRQLDESFSVDEDDEEKNHLRMTFVEAYGKKQKEYNDIQKRLETSQRNISSTRSKRLETTAQVNFSLTKFVEDMKSEEKRKQMLLLAEARNVEIEQEIDRIDSLAEHVARMYGVSKEEATNN